MYLWRKRNTNELKIILEEKKKLLLAEVEKKNRIKRVEEAMEHILENPGKYKNPEKMFSFLNYNLMSIS